MAGHSKWANTRYRKAIQDTKRDKIFTKIIRNLSTAARIGGTNLTSNPRLRTTIEKALSSNMTRDTLNRAILRGMREDESSNTKTFVYEGYGPGGVAMIVECLSDNRNRTASFVRHAFSKNGGNLGTEGSVSYLFNKKGIISFENNDEAVIMEVAIEAGASDVVANNDYAIDVVTSWDNITVVRNAIEAIGIRASSAKISMIPSVKIEIDKENQKKLLHLLKMLKNCDDVQKVYHNSKLCSFTSTSS